MSEQIDCPICMDCIETTNKNCVTTQCGHCFHANCLMQSVAHNGFGCPYCRTAMAEAPQEDEETIWSDEEEEEIFDEDALRGFRFFWNNLNDVSHDEADEEEETEVEELAQRSADNQNQVDPNVPTTDFVAQKLLEQGVTFEQLVKTLCFNEHEEYQDDESCERIIDELFGKVRIIISNYNPEEAARPVTQAPAPVTQSQVTVREELDYAAQPKTRQVRSAPRFMVHV